MNFKKNSRKYWFLILGLIVFALIVFFYPKECGRWGTAVHPTAIYKDCSCIGIKYSPSVIGGAQITCFGIPISYSCYYYTIEQIPGARSQRVDIVCE